MDIMQFLASVLNPNPGQNRMVSPNLPGNYLTQTGLSPDQVARFHQMSGVAQPQPQGAPPAAVAPQQALQPNQQQTAAVAQPQAEGGGILSRLFGGGQSDGENQTIQWLQQQGMDPGTATMMAKSKPILQQYLLKRSQGQQPIEINGKLVDPNTYKVLADFSTPKDQTRQTTTIDGKLVDAQTGELIHDYSKPQAQVRDLTAEEVKQRGYPAGSYQIDEKGNVSTVGGAREQDPTFGREKDLRQEYENNPVVKSYQIVRDNYERIRQGTTLTTGAGDLAIVFGYMKMLDPTSVVREGEQAAATDVSGVPSRILNLYNSVAAGAKLPPEARSQLLDAAGQVYGEASKNLGDLNTRYGGIAKQYTLDPSRIVQLPEQYEPLSPAGGVPPPALPPEGLPAPVAPPPPARRAFDSAAGVPPPRRRSWQELVAPGIQ